MHRPAPEIAVPQLARRAGGVLLVLLVLVLVGSAPVTAMPRPPLVVEGDVPEGRVELSPATQATSGGGHVAWVLANGGADTLTFGLEVHEVDATVDGAEIGAPAGLPLGVDTVTLAPGELARIPLVLPDVTEPRALALVASSQDADPPTTLSGVVLVGGGGPVAPRVVAADAGAGTFTVRLDADGPTLVDVALRATAWPGVVHADELVEGLYVPAGGRELDVALDGAVAGRVTIEVAVGGGTGTRVTSTVWWWPPLVVGVGLLVVLAVVGAVAVLWRRRHRARSAA